MKLGRHAADRGVTIAIELEQAPEPERIVEWVAEAYAETARIMRETGCR